MVPQVATGGQSHEVLPILLLVPRFGHGTAGGGYNILGFGDMVLPGLLVVYARTFDLRHRRGVATGYFLPASIGYGAGLLLTYIALTLELGGDQVCASLTRGKPQGMSILLSSIWATRCPKRCCLALLPLQLIDESFQTCLPQV